MSESIIGPIEMGKQLLEALGLADLRCVTKLHIAVESGSLPKLTIERAFTKKEAGALCVLLREWKCEIRPGIVAERPLTEPEPASSEQTPVHPENEALAERISKLSAEAASIAAGRSSVVINPLDRDTSVIVDLESEIKRLRRLLLETGLPEEPGQPS